MMEIIISQTVSVNPIGTIIILGLSLIGAVSCVKFLDKKLLKTDKISKENKK